MSLDPQLLEILACPDTHHAPLTYDEPAQTLTCTQCGRVFDIVDGIPVLLLDEARPAGSAPADQAGPKSSAPADQAVPKSSAGEA